MNTHSNAAQIATQKSLAKFNTLGNARSYRDHADRPGKWQILLGDNGLFWVVTNREASVLLKAGYELA